MNRRELLLAVLVLGVAFPAHAFFGLSGGAEEKECANKETQIVAMSGAEDSNTPPELIEEYVQLVKRHGVYASHRTLPGVSHNGVARNEEFFSTVRNLALGI